MTTKTLTITEDAYERLSKYKSAHDSFSDVIIKHFPKHSLLELVGRLTTKEAEGLRKHVKERRRESQERMSETARRLQ
ncbi:TPA: hypothetical protein HA241_00130 [Candidatus Woesearchaeota archaeon]|nr:hypothetical protein [Candidatus Woesearchaeota archaeon]